MRRFGKRMMEGSFGAGILKGRRGWIGVPGVVHVTEQKEKEGELILKALLPGDVMVLLDEHGKEFRSVEFANWIERKMHTVNKRLGKSM